MDRLTLTDELILEILKESNEPVSKTYIHKILFKLKKRFPKDRNLLENIPFYWYTHGPYSEVVEDRLSNLEDNLTRLSYYVKSETVSRQSKNGTTHYYRLINEPPKFKLINDYEEDISELIKQFPRLGKLVKNIYYNDAPYEFQPLYKIELLTPLTNKELTITSEEDFKEKIDLNDILDKLYDCECELPYEKLFKGYSKSFSRFTSVLDRLFDEINYKEFEEVSKLTNIMWDTFSKGLRVAKHDNFEGYTRNVGNWRNRYHKEVDKTNKNIDEMRKKVFSQCKCTEYPPYSKTTKKILKSTVGQYLSN